MDCSPRRRRGLSGDRREYPIILFCAGECYTAFDLLRSAVNSVLIQENAGNPLDSLAQDLTSRIVHRGLIYTDHLTNPEQASWLGTKSPSC